MFVVTVVAAVTSFPPWLPLLVAAAAARHPRTSVTESGANRTSETQHRSAITGHYITPAAAARHPHTSITENKK
ncbi:hypothetical protein BWO91_19125 [Plantibacter flavus]|uniref:hypothetical protein n=1 Tax=Plantibacter flavus TaxID=150123 RepID=UPI00099BEE38|nr:hypothetical protein [Plantibacter flavus]AQX81784.1 hypothetical protein BWO91_19125 [Plantibacter flavus]